MGYDDMWSGLGTTAAQSKRPSEDPPRQQPMRAGLKPAEQKRPTGDQKKHRRQMSRRADMAGISCPSCGFTDDPDHFESDTFEYANGDYSVKCPQCGIHFDSQFGHETTEHLGRPTASSTTGPTPSSDSSRTSTKESTMTERNQPTEADILQRMASAPTLMEQSALAVQLEAVRDSKREAAAQESSLDWGALDAPMTQDSLASHFLATQGQGIASLGHTLASHEGPGIHTSAEYLGAGSTSSDTDWLAFEATRGSDDATMGADMRAKASLWYSDANGMGVMASVKDSRQEFSTQAHNAAARAGSEYGIRAQAAASVFLAQVDHMHKKAGFPSIVTASGACPCGKKGDFLHHEDGTLRGSAPTSNGKDLERFEREIAKHRSQHTAAFGDNERADHEGGTPTYHSDGRDSLPVGVSPSDAKTHDDAPGTDSRTGAPGTDPKTTTDGGVQESLAEGSTPEGDKSESGENPLTGDTSLDKSKGEFGNDKSDRAQTQASRTADIHWGSKWEVGDVIERDGQKMIISRISPAGQAGTSHADGPTYHAVFMDEDGKPRMNGLTKDIWSKSMSNPTSAWTKVEGKTSSRTASLVCNNTDCDTKSSSGKPGDACSNCGEGRLIKGDSVAETDKRNKERFGSLDAMFDAARHFASQDGGIQTYAEAIPSGVGEGLGIDEGSTPEGDHAESPIQEPGQGAADMSAPTDSDRPGGGVNWGSTASQHTAFDYPGAGRWVPASALQGDDMKDASSKDPEGNTKDGHYWVEYKRSSLSANAQVFAQTLRSMASLDETRQGLSGHQVASYLINDPTCPENVRQALRGGVNPFAREAGSGMSPDDRAKQDMDSETKGGYTSGYADAEEGFKRKKETEKTERSEKWWTGYEQGHDDYALDQKTGSRTASDGASCSECGGSIERDPEGEQNRGWHHADGSKHEHEARPGGSVESSRKTAAPNDIEVMLLAKSLRIQPEDVWGALQGASAFSLRIPQSDVDYIRQYFKGKTGAQHTAAPEGWWPQTRPNPHFPGEMTLGCPKCGGPVSMEGYHGPGGRLGDPGGGTTLRCQQCGHSQSFSGSTDTGFLSSRRTAGIDQDMYDWGYSAGERVRNGQVDQVPGGAEVAAKYAPGGEYHGSDKPFPRGWQDGLDGKPKQSLGSKVAGPTHLCDYCGSSQHTFEEGHPDKAENLKGGRDYGDNSAMGSLHTAAGSIAWKDAYHFGVGYMEGKAANGDNYEVYYNPNSNPTPCSWVNYGEKNGDTHRINEAPKGEGRGFVEMIEAMRDAERDAASHIGSRTAALTDLDDGALDAEHRRVMEQQNNTRKPEAQEALKSWRKQVEDEKNRRKTSSQHTAADHSRCEHHRGYCEVLKNSPGDTPSISDFRNEEGEWLTDPQGIRSEMAWEPDPYDHQFEGSRRTAANATPKGGSEVDRIDSRDRTSYKTAKCQNCDKAIYNYGRGGWVHQTGGGRCLDSNLRAKTKTSVLAPGSIDLSKVASGMGQVVAMPNPVDLGVAVGDFFYDSWGYDQTNIDFYEVVGLTGASVKVREVRSKVVGSNGSQEEVVPVPGGFTGPSMTKRIQNYGSTPSFTVNSFSAASKWDGKPKSQTAAGWGH